MHAEIPDLEDQACIPFTERFVVNVKFCCGYRTYSSLMFCQQYSGESASVLMMVDDDLETFDN